MGDQVFGMQYFDTTTRQSHTNASLPSMADFVDGYYEADGRQWFVFSAKTLSQHNDFLNV